MAWKRLAKGATKTRSCFASKRAKNNGASSIKETRLSLMETRPQTAQKNNGDGIGVSNEVGDGFVDGNGDWIGFVDGFGDEVGDDPVIDPVVGWVR